MAGTPAQVAQKWSRNLSNAQDAIRQGIERVNESPSQTAARSADFWQSQVASQSAKEKFVAGGNRVSVEQWRAAMRDKGLSRIASGATAGQPKMESFLSEFLPFVESVAQRVRQMPKTTLEDRLQRAITQMRGNAAFRRTR